MDIRHGWIQGRRHSRKPSSRLSAELCWFHSWAGSLGEAPGVPPSSAGWHPGGARTRLLSSPAPALRATLVTACPERVVVAGRTLRPGDATARGAGLRAPHVGAALGESRGEDKQEGGLDAGSSKRQLLRRHGALSQGRGGRPRPRTSGHFAQNGHGQTLRDLALHWKEPHRQDRDAGCSLSEAGSFDRQGQAWRGPAMRVIPASV